MIVVIKQQQHLDHTLEMDGSSGEEKGEYVPNDDTSHKDFHTSMDEVMIENSIHQVRVV